MTYTLFDLTLRVARELGGILEGLATAGDAASLTDDNDLKNVFSDDHFNRGTLWLTYDAAGAGAAPQGEFTRVSDFVGSTGVVSFRDNLTAAVGAGDEYALSNRAYRLDTIIRMVNRVLRGIMVPTDDISTITTAAEQTEYDLPLAVLDPDIEVWIQGKTSDTNDYKWQRVHDWYVKETGRGVANKLIFRTQPPQPYLLRLVYNIPHAEMHAASDQLMERIDINRVALAAALECLQWKSAQPGVHQKDLDRRIATMSAEAERAKWAAPLGNVHVKLATWGDTNRYLDTEDS